MSEVIVVNLEGGVHKVSMLFFYKMHPIPQEADSRSV